MLLCSDFQRYEIQKIYDLYHGVIKEKETQLWKTAVFQQLVFSTRELKENEPDRVFKYQFWMIYLNKSFKSRFVGRWKKDKEKKRLDRSKVWAEKKRVYIGNGLTETENNSKSH